jgi:hypothetical protein
VDVIVTSKKGSKKPRKTQKEVVLVEEISLLKKAQKRAKKAYKKTARLMKKALRWMSKKSRKAYLRGMAWAKTAAKWTKAKAVAGASVVAAVATSTWVRTTTAAAWAWSYTAPIFYWMSTPTRAVVGSLFGLSVWSLFGPATFLTIGAGLVLYLALSSTRTTRIVKVKGHKTKRAQKKLVEDMLTEERLTTNVEQNGALMTLMTELQDERDEMAKKATVQQLSRIAGQIALVGERLDGNTGTVKEIFEYHKRILTTNGQWENFDGLAFNTGMRTANAKVNKLLAEYQTETIVVEA